MSQIKQLLLLHQQGRKIKVMARSLGMSKNTIKSYLARLAGQDKTIEELLGLDDPSLQFIFHGGNPAYKDERYEYIKERLEYYAAELKRTGVTQKLLWEEYIAEVPDGYGLTQFSFHLRQQLVARKPSMVMSYKPGEKLYVDFAGQKLSYVDHNTGTQVECSVFVACLPFSDYAFALAVPSQSLDDFIYALKCCIESLGGSPELLVPDNLKSAVIRADRYDPDLNRALEDFCNHFGMTILPTRVASPKDKALVENQVKLIYNRVYAKLRHQQFFDLASLNEAVREKIRMHNQTRMKKKPYCREERFRSSEKTILKPLPEESYEIKYYRGEMIALHPRNYTAGGYTTTLDHLCSHHQHYLQRSPAYYMDRAAYVSQDLLTIIKALFDGGRPAEQNYRTCDGLLNLHRKTEPEIFDAACKNAIEDKCYSYKYLLNIIDRFQKTGLQEQIKETPLPKHENIRGKEYYHQLSLNL